jgi:hypothetical protein
VDTSTPRRHIIILYLRSTIFLNRGVSRPHVKARRISVKIDLHSVEVQFDARLCYPFPVPSLAKKYFFSMTAHKTSAAENSTRNSAITPHLGSTVRFDVWR